MLSWLGFGKAILAQVPSLSRSPSGAPALLGKIDRYGRVGGRGHAAVEEALIQPAHAAQIDITDVETPTIWVDPIERCLGDPACTPSEQSAAQIFRRILHAGCDT